MANGGFKAFAYEVQGLGSAEALEKKMERCREVLAALGDGLVGLDQGWSYDDSKTASGEAAILSGDLGSPQSYSLYFRHTSGVKLMLTYNVYGVGFGSASFYTPNGGSSTWRFAMCGGLAVSIIPATCGEFDPYASVPMPANGFRLLAPGSVGSYNNEAASFLYNGETTEIFKYFLIVRGTQVIILSKPKNDATKFNIIFAGDVVDCAHSTDTHDYSRFAEFLSAPQGTGSERGAQVHGTSYYAFDTSYCLAQFYTCSGALKCGYPDKAHVRGVQTAVDCNGTAANVVRWFPVMLYAEGTTDGSCVMENDGFKGYVNHEVCCITKNSNLAVGQLLDGGNFIYLGGGLIIGWDPANEVTLF